MSSQLFPSSTLVRTTTNILSLVTDFLLIQSRMSGLLACLSKNCAKISNSNNVKTNYMYERNYILINIIGVTMFFYQKLLLDKISDEIKI